MVHDSWPMTSLSLDLFYYLLFIVVFLLYIHFAGLLHDLHSSHSISRVQKTSVCGVRTRRHDVICCGAAYAWPILSFWTSCIALRTNYTIYFAV